MAKEFWKIRKEFNMSQTKDEVFVYFIIKFQYTSLEMAINVINRSKKYKYLFDTNSYRTY